MYISNKSNLMISKFNLIKKIKNQKKIYYNKFFNSSNRSQMLKKKQYGKFKIAKNF